MHNYAGTTVWPPRSAHFGTYRHLFSQMGGYMDILQVRNWATYQHYKDRNPPWIKLHFSLISSKDWVMLDDASRVLALACMLIASRSELGEGRFEADPDYIQRVAYLNTVPDFNPLINTGFLVVASGCKQMLANARPETETEERQRRGETEISRKKTRSKSPLIPLPENFTISSKVRQWAEIKGYNNLEAHFENFIEQAEAKGYMYASWDAALRKAIREDWAGLKKSKLAPKTENDWESRGRELGIQANPGESWESYIARIRRESERTVQ